MAALFVVGVAGGCAPAPEPVPTVAPSIGADGTRRIEVSVVGGVVEGGVLRYAVPRGVVVQLVVASDVADQVHVRGYERFGYVTTGASSTMRFVADRAGVFDAELERRGLMLAQLQVG